MGNYIEAEVIISTEKVNAIYSALYPDNKFVKRGILIKDLITDDKYNIIISSILRGRNIHTLRNIVDEILALLNMIRRVDLVVSSGKK